jgi:5'-nucleotidase
MPQVSGESKRPLILITNDDGISSAGLRAAAEAGMALGDVLIVAPKTKQTAMARSFPLGETHGVIERQTGVFGAAGIPCYTVIGSPAQVVAHAVLEIAPCKPAFCISGINDGENLGATNLVSGTVGCACEAAAFGIPAIAISVGPETPALFEGPYRAEDWMVAQRILVRFAKRALRHGLPVGVDFLNINIPLSATLDTEIRTTIQSRQNHYVCARPGARDFSKPRRLPVTEQIDFESLEPQSDLYAFRIDKVVSVTPMACDLTARNATGAPVPIRFGNSEDQLLASAYAD